MKRVYLDYAAATPLDRRVHAAMQPYLSEQFHNPSALYREALAVKQALNDARAKVARCIGAKPSEIIFTAGGTESANLAIDGIAQLYPNGTLLVSAIEHDAVLQPAAHYKHQRIPVSAKGIVDLERVSDSIDDATVLISVMLVNNEVGTIQPIAEIASLVHDIRRNRTKRGVSTPLLLHTDACQAPLYLAVDVAHLGVDLMTLNGGKIYGPKQSGILYRRAGVTLTPLIKGGGQEFGLRSGTEHVAAAVGFAQALTIATQGRVERTKQVTLLRDWFMKELEERYGAIINGHRLRRVAHNIHVQFPGTDNERVLFALDDLGVAAAAGSACSAAKQTASHVLQAMGLTTKQARSSIRMTISQETTEQELAYVLDVLEKAIKS